MVLGLHGLDVAVILGYLLGIAAIGIYVARRVKDTAGYFTGNRGFGKLLMIGQAFGVGTQAEHPVGVAGAAYQHGISGIWYTWKYIFCTPFYWLIAPVFRRLRRVTTADVYEDRYGSGAALLYTVFALVYFILNQAVMLAAAAKVFSVVTGGEVQPMPAILGMTVVFVIYSYLGGLVSAATTDFVQSFFIIIMSFMLIPLGLGKIGGVGALHGKLAPAMFELWSSSEIGGFTIAVLAVSSLISIFTQPQTLAMIGTGKTEMNCRVGFTYGSFIKRLCAIGWAFVGLLVAVMIPGLPEGQRENAFGLACQQLLGPGLLGLMIACVLATNMSTCSATMVDTGAIFTENIYRRHVRREAADAHYLRIGRMAGVVSTAAAVVIATLIQRVLGVFLITDNLAALMGISLVAAIVWRRANRYGAFASVVVAVAAYYTGSYFECLRTKGGFDFEAWNDWYAWPSFWSLVAGSLAMVVVSLLTRPEPAEKIEDFYRRLRTPAMGDDAPQGRAPGARGEGEPPSDGRGLLLVDLLSLRRTFSWRGYREDVRGFLVAGGVVGLLIGLALLVAWVGSS